MGCPGAVRRGSGAPRPRVAAADPRLAAAAVLGSGVADESLALKHRLSNAEFTLHVSYGDRAVKRWFVPRPWDRPHTQAERRLRGGFAQLSVGSLCSVISKARCEEGKFVCCLNFFFELYSDSFSNRQITWAQN